MTPSPHWTRPTLRLRAGHFHIELQFHPGSRSLCLVFGQAIDLRNGRPVAGATVAIEGGRGRAVSDDEGVFVVSCDAPKSAQELRIRIDGEETRCLVPAA
jgi:hypothetical protein